MFPLQLERGGLSPRWYVWVTGSPAPRGQRLPCKLNTGRAGKEAGERLWPATAAAVFGLLGGGSAEEDSKREPHSLQSKRAPSFLPPACREPGLALRSWQSGASYSSLSGSSVAQPAKLDADTLNQNCLGVAGAWAHDAHWKQTPPGGQRRKAVLWLRARNKLRKPVRRQGPLPEAVEGYVSGSPTKRVVLSQSQQLHQHQKLLCVWSS